MIDTKQKPGHREVFYDRMPIACYLATALTNLSELERAEVFSCSDVAASELLFPWPFFDNDVHARSPGLRSVLDLASLYRGSVGATVRRYVSVHEWKCFFIFWELAPSGSARRLIAKALIRKTATPLFGEDIAVREYANLLKALESNDIMRHTEQLSVGGFEDEYYIETMRLGSARHPRLLSMVVTEPSVTRRRRVAPRAVPQLGLFPASEQS
ncbi:MAG: hypothetical protein ACLQOO_26725 [Terriglobia bacterium]